MKRVIDEYAQQCLEGHWTWSTEQPVTRCPHMVKGRQCTQVAIVRGKKKVTVEQ